MYQAIMVAYDESPEAQAALRESMSLAVAFGSRVILVTVLEPIPSFYQLASIVAPEVPQQLISLRRQQIESLQSNALALAAQKGVSAAAVIPEGDEVQQLVAAARDEQPDLLVLGLHKHDTLARWVGTAHLVAQAVNCSVLAVHQG